MFLLGTVWTIASVPLFIIVVSNQRKARLSLKEETISYGIKGNTFNSPSLLLSIPLNKYFLF